MIRGTILSNQTIFNYIIVIIICIIIFRKYDIQLNFLFGLFVAYLIIDYYYKIDLKEDLKNKEIFEEKKKSLLPKTKKLEKYQDIVNYLYSIQELYYDNPETYINFIESIEMFFKYYEQVKIDKKLSGVNFELMERKKQLSLNFLSSFMINLKTNKSLYIKLERSLDELENILLKYHNETYNSYLDNLHEEGYNVNTKLIDLGPKSLNEYDDRKFSFNIF